MQLLWITCAGVASTGALTWVHLSLYFARSCAFFKTVYPGFLGAMEACPYCE